MAEPQITVSILSWLLEDRLIRTLTLLPRSTNLPLNLCLHVQGVEQITPQKKQEILDATAGFFQRDIFFTINNQGSATPRALLLKRSAVTPYVFITDNDMEFQPGSIDTLYDFLEHNKDYGMVDLVNNFLKYHRRIVNGQVETWPVNFDGPRVVDVDMIGAASVLMRRELALSDIIDHNYYLGSWDLDMCLNVRKLGWKIATISDKSLISINDITYRTPKYKACKYNRIRQKGIKLFEQKWGFSPEMTDGIPWEVKPIKTDTAVITRAIFTHCSDIVEVGSLTPKRLSMMQTNMINSLRAQSDPDFDLCIICGPEHCDATKAIKSLDYGTLRVSFIYNETDLSQWKDSISESSNWGREVDEGCPEVIAKHSNHPLSTIMARMDIDDWVTPGWIASMKHLSVYEDDESFIINYQVIGQGPDGRLYKFHAPHVKHRTSPFLALVQKGDEKLSPYEDVHLNMGKLFERCITIQPSYCFMVVHGENRSNRLYQFDNYFEDIATDRPRVIPAKLTESPIQITQRILKAAPRNSWKQRIVKQQVR